MIPKPSILDDSSTERGVSPVIGVILMVAITVILAAVIGTFVLNLSNQTGDTAPNAQVSVADASDDYNPDSTIVAFGLEHRGGEDLSADQTVIRIRHDSNNSLVAELTADNGFEDGTVNATINSKGASGTLWSSGTLLSTGDKLFINGDTNADLSDNNQYRVVVYDTESDKSVSEAVVTLK